MGLSCRLCGVPLLVGFRFYKCVGGVIRVRRPLDGAGLATPFGLKDLSSTFCCATVCDG